MPSVSRKQQKLMGMVYAYKKGKLKNASPTIKKISKSMNSSDVKHFAETKHKDLPEKVKESKILDFITFVNESNKEKRIEDMSDEELKDENNNFIKLQNKGKLTSHEERRWKKISKKLN